MSIFNGIDEILDNWLGLIGHGNKFGSQKGVPKYKSKKAAIALSEKGSPLNGHADNDSVAEVVSACVTKMEENLKGFDLDNIPSSNWEWEKSLHLASHSTSQEKTLEKLVAFLLDENWMNQMSVCNGLHSNAGANACRVDLVHRNDTSYDLIELKYSNKAHGGSDQPLYAAMEILRYGLVYLLFRKLQPLNRKMTASRYHIMKATQIRLVVLAPSSWYIYKKNGTSQTFNFKWLEKSLTSGLIQAIQDIPTMKSIEFAFEVMTPKACEQYIILKNAVDHFRRVKLASKPL
ncbi:MAG: hypothetical protein CME32_19535 [Gimesia sp.]|uniref:Uncharacterized protein n=1 Tax=Gimesia chilikensis TaxID=2605989 RepID=A0A517PKF3_9PLAN|nr:hypothetical protein [Gimesia chilikensis]MBN71462.1 hypothetical protein [Gimesia sp.]QDT19856.1 hypothetical protein HG66A1_16240 [Gimesia chilikensis]